MVSIGKPGLARIILALKAVACCLVMNLFVTAAAGRQIPDLMETGSSANSLYAQGAAQRLSREFQRGNLSFLLLDAGTGALLASHWDNPDQPIPMGSLIKPFVAL